MSIRKIHQILTYFIVTVWLINGLICKVLNFVPRHEQIVARILGGEYSRPLTFLIGLGEITLAIWILAGIRTRETAILQILLVATMNILEFFITPDLLLWGKMNAFFAFLFISVVYFNEFYLNKIDD